MGFSTPAINSHPAYSTIKVGMDLASRVLPNPLVVKITNFIIVYFDLLRQVSFLTTGLDELYRTGIRKASQAIAERESSAVSIFSKEFFYQKIVLKIKEADEHILRGGCIVSSGVFGAIAALHDLNSIKLKASMPALFLGLSNGLFLGASLFTLHLSVKQYWEAKAILEQNLSPQKNSQAQRTCYSAVMGVISSLGYIASVACYFMAAPAVMALVFGIIGGLSGGIKVLYDWFYDISETNLVY